MITYKRSILIIIILKNLLFIKTEKYVAYMNRYYWNTSYQLA